MSMEESFKRAIAEVLAPLRADMAELRRDLRAMSPNDEIGDEECRTRYGGGKTRGAWNVWLSRHPDFPMRKVGRKQRLSGTGGAWALLRKVGRLLQLEEEHGKAVSELGTQLPREGY